MIEVASARHRYDPTERVSGLPTYPVADLVPGCATNNSFPMHIEVERLAIGKRHREVWTLWVESTVLSGRLLARVDQYERQEHIPTTGWHKIGDGYRRQTTPATARGWNLPADKVPWGPRIVRLVRDQIAAITTIVGPSDDG